MFSIAEITETEKKLNELRSFKVSDHLLFPILIFLHTNADTISLHELNTALKKKVSDLELAENFIETLETWYSLLSPQQRVILQYILTSGSTTQ